MKQGKQQYNKITALYCRLSCDDNFNGDSMSIQTQKALLKRYAEDNGFYSCEYFVDDGYSGTNYDRPDFQRLLSEIEAGNIGTVIVKDLSRLGREYLQTGYYTEIFFPKHDVRFIAINDGVDSDNGDNEFAPFKNIINEWYAKDISRKIRSSVKIRAQKGEFSASYAPFGYKKSPENKHKLIPDERADIVRRIFQMALEGKGCQTIAKALNEDHIPTPKEYIYDQNGNLKYTGRKLPYGWRESTIRNILKNEVYLGTVVRLKSRSKSFKDKTKIYLPKSEWVYNENMHEPIIDKETFYTVQNRVSKKKPITSNPNAIFKGLLRCGECGYMMAFMHRPARTTSDFYRCSHYVRFGKNACTAHLIRLDDLKELVRNDINRHIRFISDNKEKYAKQLMEITGQSERKPQKLYEKELSKAEKRITELNTLIQKLYEDKVFERITEDMFATMSASMGEELTRLKAYVSELNEKLKADTSHEHSIDDFIHMIEQYSEVTELDTAILNNLIEKIVVHDKQEVDGRKIMPVEIYYRFAGKINDNEYIRKR